MTDEARDETAGEATAGPAGRAAKGAGRAGNGAASREATASAAADDSANGATTGAGSGTAADSAEEAERPKVVIKDNRRVDRNGEAGKPVAEEVDDTSAESEENGQLDELRAGLEELTRDLQRVTAEYANYRKRVDRDRTLVAEQAVGSVLTQLLPVLDDLDRARSHGDLVGPFATVAEQLSAALGKFGLTAFGDVGDPFDPTLHEAVAHTSSPDVTETSCIEIMRRGYLLGERLLRPALVAVADPE